MANKATSIGVTTNPSVVSLYDAIGKAFDQYAVEGNLQRAVEFYVKPVYAVVPQSEARDAFLVATSSYLTYLISGDDQSTDTDDLLEKVKALVDIAVQCEKLEISMANGPLIIVKQFFECQTMDICEKFFPYLEENLDTYTEMPNSPIVRNSLLRICNALLRRLSKAQETVFCGRILMFLANLIPIEDRSGFNVNGAFNVGNKTICEKHHEASEVSVGADGQPIDYNFYTKFWSLQTYFSSPDLCFDRKHFASFRECADIVLEAYSSGDAPAADAKESPAPRERSHTASERTNRESSMSAAAQNDGSASQTDDGIDQTYFAKYLTSSKLLSLQMSDRHFKRTILMQMLILCQHLRTSKKPGQVLTKDEEQYVKTLSDKALAALAQEKSAAKPSLYSDLANRIFAREQDWITWKNEKCDPSVFTKRVVEDGDEEMKPPPAKRVAVGARGAAAQKGDALAFIRQMDVGNQAALEATPDCKVPTFDQFFDEALDLYNPADEIEAEYLRTRDPVWLWAAARHITLTRLADVFDNKTLQSQPGLMGLMDHLLLSLWKKKTGYVEPVAPKADENAPAEGATDSQPTAGPGPNGAVKEEAHAEPEVKGEPASEVSASVEQAVKAEASEAALDETAADGDKASEPAAGPGAELPAEADTLAKSNEAADGIDPPAEGDATAKPDETADGVGADAMES